MKAKKLFLFILCIPLGLSASGNLTYQSDDVISLHSLKKQTGIGGVVLGIRLMPTVTNLDYDEENGTVEAAARLGYGIGGLIGVNLTDHIGIHLEAIYSSLAQRYRVAEYEANIKLKYINFPVMLSLNTGFDNPINLNIAAGPQLGLNIGSDLDVKSGGDSVNARLAVKKGDLGFAYGAGIDIGLGSKKLSLGFRGVFGLLNISDRSNTISTNEYFILDRTHIKTYSAYIGLTFGG